MSMNTSRSDSTRKRLLLGCGVILAPVAAFLFWWSRNPIVFTVPEGLMAEVVARQLEDADGDELVVELELMGEGDSYRITEVSLERQLADRLGLSPPEGFREEPLTLEEEDRSDPETVRFVTEWNAENVSWVCDLEIVAGVPIVVRIPAANAGADSGVLSISYESVSVLGGHWSSTTLMLNEVAASE